LLTIYAPGWDASIIWEILVNFAVMFLIGMICHGELARLKPGTSHLTEYYLLMSAGGAIGGLLVSLLAPVVFTVYLEWELSLLFGFALACWVVLRGLLKLLPGHGAVIGGAVAIFGAVGLFVVYTEEFTFGASLFRTRNFYGTLRVSERSSDAADTDGKVEPFHSLYVSGTEHGRQFLSAERKREALTYYGKETAVGMLLDGLKGKADAKVGVIGMGTATLAAYGEKGQTYRFYEINQAVVDIAKKYFTYISDMEQRGAKYELALGDARLMLDKEADQHFDALVLDAFSGDSVPVHLLTKEAFAIYDRHLAATGVIAVHITNHYLNLGPVVERLAAEYGFKTTRICIQADPSFGHYNPDYILMSKDAAFIQAHPAVLPKNARDIPGIPLWSDHAHNLFQILEKRD
jgi:spermidine synthase